MDWSNFISGVIGAFFGGGAGGILLKLYLDHRLSIERSELAEKRLQLQKQRDASIAVAEILGEWVRSTYIAEASTNEQRWRLQTTYWKNILLLDRRLISQLFPLLANAEDAVSTNEMIVQTRKILLGLDKADIKASDLNNWSPTAP